METENKNQASELSEKSSKKKIIAIVIAIIIAAGAGSYFLPAKMNIWNKLRISGASNMAAIINGEKITKADIDSRINSSKDVFEKQGLDLSDEKVFKELEKQILDNMVSEVLILQDSKKAGISANNADVEKAYNEILAKFKDKADFDKELASRNLTDEKVKESISKQMTINKYIEQKTDIKNVAATDGEISALYAKYGEKQKDMPKLQEIKMQLENEVKQQKIRAMAIDLIEKLKKEANLKIFL